MMGHTRLAALELHSSAKMLARHCQAMGLSPPDTDRATDEFAAAVLFLTGMAPLGIPIDAIVAEALGLHELIAMGEGLMVGDADDLLVKRPLREGLLVEEEKDTGKL